MRVFMFIAGIIFLATGLLTIFSKKYFDFMTRKFWQGPLDEKLFPGKTGYWYDKYSRGVIPTIVGIGLILFAIFAF